MDSVTRYEIKAEAFRIMTGHMAPGKDPAPGSYPHSIEVRGLRFEEWSAKYGEIVRAMLIATERVME